jgi:hypothetical protein
MGTKISEAFAANPRTTWDGTEQIPINDGTANAAAGLASTLAAYVASAIDVDAVDVDVTDGGGYFAGTDVETILQEIGASIAAGGTTTGNHELTFVAGSLVPDSTAPCDAHIRESVGSSRPDVNYLRFPVAADSACQWSWVPPKSWDAGTITFKVDWMHPTTTVNFGTAWELKALAVSDNETADAAFGTAVQVVDTGGVPERRYVTPESTAVTIAGTPAKGDRLFFHLARIVGDSDDTLAVGAYLLGVTIFFTTDADTDA